MSATDKLTFTVIALSLTGVALAACRSRARRTAKADPTVAPRCD